jgi:hypothetical protein
MSSSSPRTMYFARTVVYTRRGQSVLLVDMHDASTTEPLEPWLGRVYLFADGSHTVQELIDFVGRQYAGPPPANLGTTIDSVIDRLHQSKLIAFSEQPVQLPYYLSQPTEKQDPEMANRLMAEDGFEQGELTVFPQAPFH